MSELQTAGVGIGAFLLTYLLHSTVAVGLTIVTARLKCIVNSELRVLAWKLALVLPLLSALAVAVLDVPHFGVQLPITIRDVADNLPSRTFAAVVAAPNVDTSDADTSLNELSPTTPVKAAVEPRFASRQSGGEIAGVSIDDEGHLSARSLAVVTSGTESNLASICLFAVALVMGFSVIGFIKLAVQFFQLRRIRLNARQVTQTGVCLAMNHLRQRFGIRRRVALLQSDEVAGPMTAGVLRPFILLPNDTPWNDVAKREALLAHELVHVARLDAFWNLVILLIERAFPIQPLNRLVGRQLRREMDFVADSLAAQTPAERIGLAQCLAQFGDQRVSSGSQKRSNMDLASGMASFDSMLGKRVEALLDESRVQRRLGVMARVTTVALMLAGTAIVALLVPRAVTDASPVFDFETQTTSRNSEMKRPLATLAVIAGMTLPVLADEPQTKPQAGTEAAVRTAELKKTPDSLPGGVLRFNGMLVGRLAAKDVEKGTFVIQVDAVPRVWKNSNADDPRSIVGKSVEVTGVFGRFLDVLVVTRIGETLEFECKHDGERLVFPGELLRKVEAFDPSDYPVLPESFRGFEGAVAGTVIKKDAETFELIFQVDRVSDTWDSNKAKQPQSIEGKQLMLAGFWNRKDQYHSLKVGDKLEVGMRHIGMRSDHLTVAEYVRKSEGRSEKMNDEEMMKADGESRVGDGLTKELRGFRGMLVGRLVEKDVERGTFSITVDAVPRVWNNNKATNPKSFLGRNAAAEGVTGKMLDALVVAKIGETIEFGALHEDGERMRVGEVLRKVAAVKPGDYPVLPEGFRGFRGMVMARVIRKDDHLMDMIVEITEIKTEFQANRARQSDSIIGKQAMLTGFWNRKEAFHDSNVGDTIQCGIEHPQLLSDHLSVIESVKKVR
jgi:beta-lactamase regulating signal transducer with metallopeptidase domain